MSFVLQESKKGSYKVVPFVEMPENYGGVPILLQPTAKNIGRFYGKITGNQLPVHFSCFFFFFFFTGARKHFQEAGTVW